MAAIRYVLFYKPDPGSLAKAGEFFPGHVQQAQEYHAKGKLLSFGAFANLVEDGSLGIFVSREDAEAFVASDPFVLNGIVAKHEIKEWTDTLA